MNWVTFRWLSFAALTGFAPASSDVPIELRSAWAYPMAPTVPPTVRDNTQRIRIPGSDATFTWPEVTNLYAAPDWRPRAHPPAPAVVAYGRDPQVRACGYCHLLSGDGRPENAALAGLPREYIIAQMEAFRRDERHSSVDGRGPQVAMTAAAKGATDAEIAAAADYFAGLRHANFTRVVETASVPRTRTLAWLYSRDPAGGTEPIGARIIEMPDDFERFEQRDPAMAYRAYVPPGSIARGARLARGWGGGDLACASCHGADYKGVGPIPPLAGRSPTYIVRQLNDFRTGARGGPDAAPMHQVAEKMANGDMIALAAFLGSRTP